MKKYFLNFLAVVGILFSTACTNGQQASKENLSPVDFSKKLAEKPTASLVDVRTPGEYSKGHLQNARNIDWNGGDFETDISQLDKGTPVFVYCLSGGRSSSAASKMRSMGFKEVYELQGGIVKWRSEGLPEASSNSAKGMSLSGYNELLNSDKLVLVDFYATWCGPCKLMAPYLEELSVTEKDKLIVIRIDADENPMLLKELKVEALPTLFLYKNKKMVWSRTGFVGKEEVIGEVSKQ